MNASPNVSILLDGVFNSSEGRIEQEYDVYRRIYDLPTVLYKAEVSKGLYDYVRQRNFFVLLCLYDDTGRVYLERSIQEDLVWSLPGASVAYNEALHEAVFKLASSVHPKLLIGELEPISFVENEFSFGSIVVKHRGVAFTARARNINSLSMTEVKGRFVTPTAEERGNIKRFANRQIVDLCCSKLEGFDVFIQETEIAVNEKMRLRYAFANKIVKKFVLTDRLKRKSDFLHVIRESIGSARSIIDVSCGDDRTLSKLISELPKVEVALANDISWGQLQYAKSFDSRILLTNHDATKLPFREKIFDVAICCNTLHHMPNRKLLNQLFGSIKRVARKVIFVEIEDPQETGGFAWLLHRYWYVGFLKDVGGAYLSNQAFKAIISDAFGEKASTFSEFRNIQGNYMIAVCDTTEQNSGSVFEVEKKFICEDASKVRDLALSSGFEETGIAIEVDSYYSDQAGAFISNRTCLRVREKDGMRELTFKGPSDELTSFFSKKEINVGISGPGAAPHHLLSALGYQLYVTLNKQRQAFSKVKDGLISNVVIDTLDNIGTVFVECEVIAKSSDYKEAALEAFAELQARFQSLMSREVNAPYRDIVADQIRQRFLNYQNLKALLVDFDGTLVPSEKVFCRSWQKVMAQHCNATFSREDYRLHELNKGNGLLKVLRADGRLSSPLNDSEIMNLVYSEYETAFNEVCSSPRTYHNLHHLERLRSKFDVTIVTSSRKVFVEKAFMAAGLRCPRIISSESVDWAKPNPAGYLKALESIGFAIDEVLAVEDSVRGVEAARAAGVQVVAASGDFESIPEEFADMHLQVFQNFGQIALLLTNG